MSELYSAKDKNMGSRWTKSSYGDKCHRREGQTWDLKNLGAIVTLWACQN